MVESAESILRVTRAENMAYNAMKWRIAIKNRLDISLQIAIHVLQQR